MRTTIATALVAGLAGVLLTACSHSAPDAGSPMTTPATAPATASRPGSPAAATTATAGGPSVPSGTVTTGTTASWTGGSSSPPPIPWDQVGPGWSAVVVAAVLPGAVAPGSDLSTVAGTLVLVSPQGVRYPLGETPPGESVADVSPDGRRILLSDEASRTPAIDLWDAVTGRSHRLLTGAAQAEFSRPSGSAVIAAVPTASGANGSLARYGLDGRLQLTYASDGGDAALGALRSPDGSSLVEATRTDVAVVGNATGRVVRTLPTPLGYSSCLPRSWWDGSTVLTACWRAGADGWPSSLSDLFTAPLTGGPMTRLTTATPGQDTFGFVDAWPTPTGVLLHRGAGCGNGGYAMLTAAGRGTDLRFPEKDTSEDGPTVLAVVGSTAYLSVTSGEGECGGGQFQTLVAHDLVTGASRPLVGPLAGTGVLAGSPVVIDASV